MNQEMYFIPLFVEAFRQQDPRSALTRAFAEIVRLGQMPEYRRGYEQFVHWMRLVATIREELGRQDSDRDQIGTLALSRPMRFRLYRDDRLIASFTLQQGGRPATVDRIRPGRFRLLFETGWEIWEQALTAEDLLWNKAYPRSPVPMAADDGRQRMQPTLEMSVPGTGLTIRVTPGLGAGQLTLQLTSHEGQP